jgi:peptidoglycan/LPS O-acetylase OafA/YrhL
MSPSPLLTGGLSAIRPGQHRTSFSNGTPASQVTSSTTTSPTLRDGSATRIIPLECLRGVAALVVVMAHTLSGLAPDSTAYPRPGSLVFAALNGSAAVAFFFVLSGFVLPLSYFRGGQMRTIVVALVRRWPRLAGLTTGACVISWLLFATGAYHYQTAGMLSGSQWLQTMGNALFPVDFAPAVTDAVRQGSVSAFFAGDTYYDPVLWTMRFEMAGSVVSLLLATLLLNAPRAPGLIVAGLVAAGLYALDSRMVGFVVGTYFGHWLQGRAPSLALWQAALMIMLSLVLLGVPWNGAVGVYAPLATVLPSNDVVPLLWDAGACLLIGAVLGCRDVGALLSTPLAVLLGRISFPVYLVHFPILCSLGSWIYVCAAGEWGDRLAIVAGVVATLAATLSVSLPLATFDRWWVRRVKLIVAELSAITVGLLRWLTQRVGSRLGTSESIPGLRRLR